MLDDPMTLWLVAIPLLTFIGWVSIDVLRGIARFGLSCYRGFVLAWILAYIVPVVIWGLVPTITNDFVTMAWLSNRDWIVSIFLALSGLGAFIVGYRLGHRVGNKKKNVWGYTTTKKAENLPTLALLLFCILLQLFPIYKVWAEGIRIEFTHRKGTWDQIGMVLYLLYLCLPAVTIAGSYYWDRPSKLRGVLWLLCFAVSMTSATCLGQRTFMVVILIISILIYSSKRNVKGLSVLGIASLLGFALALGYKYFLRDKTIGDLGGSFYAILMGDFARNQFLVYVIDYVDIWKSNIVWPPIIPSYLYWTIMVIPRAVWVAKPYETALQFNQHLGYSLNIVEFAQPIDKLFSGNAFGIIEEALLNLGLMGFLLIVAWGFAAGWIDKYTRYPLLSKIVLPLFFLFAALYPFHAALMGFGPLLLLVFLYERMQYRQRP
jgi:hypothetical protein